MLAQQRKKERKKSSHSQRKRNIEKSKEDSMKL